MKLFYAPIQPFLWHPERAYLLAALFVVLLIASLARFRTFKPHHLVMLFAALLWMLFGMNEVQAKANGWDIRVDVLVTWPILFAVSIGAAWTALRNLAS